MANSQIGQVIKLSLPQTATVQVVAYKNHPVYKKRYVYSKKYLVHDPQGLAKLEDRVVIRQSRPISRRKRWVLEKVLVRGGHEQVVKSDLQAIEAAVVPPPKERPAKVAAAKSPSVKPAATKKVAVKDQPVKAAKKPESKPAVKAAVKKLAVKPAVKKPATKSTAKEAKK